MDLMMKIAIIIIVALAAIGTFSFVITNIIKLKRSTKSSKRKNVSSFIIDFQDATIDYIKERYKEINHDYLIVPDDDAVPTNKITTATLIDMKNGTMYLLDRKSAPSGKDILEVCKPGTKIYDLPGGMFIVNENDLDMEKLYEGAEE